ncbi:MAG: cell division protein FtsQ/DivIB [Pseudolabrys sp.]
MFRRNAPRNQRAHSRAHVLFGRWRRMVRRWTAPVLHFDLPYGVGSAAAIVLVLTSFGYGLVRGGHVPMIAEEIQDICDAAANAVGFRVSSVALSGEKQLTRDDIFKLAGITDRTSLVFVNAAAMRARLKASPWVADATVLKLYPDRLQIHITEREAFALWQQDGQVSVISIDGVVLEPFVPQRFRALPLVVGRGAEHEARDFLHLIADYRDIADNIRASVLVAERRWNLYLKSGLEIRLPETGVPQALATLVKLDHDKKLFSRDIAAVDLRLQDRVIVRLSDAAAAARAEALKEKDKKPKRKGSDA